MNMKFTTCLIVCAIFWFEYEIDAQTGYLNTTQKNFDKKLTRIARNPDLGQKNDDIEEFWIKNSNELKAFSATCRKLSYVKQVHIDNAGIETFDKDSLVDCKNLEVLDMRGNNVRELPENLLAGNAKLIRLYLKKSPLTTLPDKFFANQKELVFLDFRECKINFLPSNIFLPLVKLHFLQLADNKLQTINPEWFATLQNLKLLYLIGNGILEVQPRNFVKLRNLEELSLRENKVRILYSNSFEGLQNLKSLFLDYNEISDLPANIFAPLKNLRTLYLNDNKLAIIHSDSFGAHSQLTEIYLEHNSITAFDERIIDKTAVNKLNFQQNVCKNDLLENRSKIKKELKTCFADYQPRYLPESNDQSSESTCGKQSTGQGNIIGGTQIVRGNYPWNAALIRSKEGSFFCGGTLISDRKVITAAHCIQEKSASVPLLKRDMIVLLGAFDLKKSYEPGRNTFVVQSIEMHPDWNPLAESFDADITVLVLENKVVFTTNIQPICLGTSNSPIAALSTGLVVGYGKSEDKTKFHENIPKQIEMPIHKNEDCFLNYYLLAKLSSRRTFCGGTGTGIGVCLGDSGSGLIMSDGNTFYLRGIVSSSLIGGPFGCDLDAYSVFTDIFPYVDWINGISTSRFKRNELTT